MHTPLRLSLFDLFDDLYVPNRLLGGATNSIRLHLVSLRMFAVFLGREPTLEDLTDDTVAQFTAWYLGRNSARETVTRTVDKVLAQWRYYHRRQLLDRWPTVQRPRSWVSPPDAWTADELLLIVDAAGRMWGDVGRNPAGRWWRALVLVLLDTAARIGAVLDAQRHDYHRPTQTLILRAETQKHRRTETYRLRERTCEAVDALRPSTGRLFPWPYSRSNFCLHWRRLIRLAGFTPDRRTGPQKIRRSVATLIAERHGVAVASEFLRHSSQAVTRRHYLDERHLSDRLDPERLLP